MILEKDVKAKIEEGVDLLCSAVQTTLGPNGANVILHNDLGVPYATKDGVSVARKVSSEDPYVEAVINIVRETAMKTAELAGDATTTTTILTSTLIKNGLANKADRLYIEGMQHALKHAIDALKRKSIHIDWNSDKLKEVATISANNDKEIGDLVARAFKTVGENGTVLFEESPTNKTYLEESAGTIIDRGYADSAFVTNNKTLTAEYNNPAFLLIDDRVDKFSKIEKLLNDCVKNDRDLIIFAHDFSSEVIRMLALNHYKGIIRTVPITVEGIGSGKGEFIKDIAALVGANKASEGIYYWGTCKHIVVSNVSTIITVEETNNPEFNERLDRIKALIDNETDETTKAFYQKKLAKLAGKLCTIKVGGFTPAERKERYDRVEDAVCATRAALEEGIVPGGGITFYRISEEMGKVNTPYTGNTNLGFISVLNALTIPIFTLAYNSGMDHMRLRALLSKCKPDEGINFKTLFSANLLNLGIIDSTKAMRVALEHAVSAASILLNTKCIIP